MINYLKLSGTLTITKNDCVHINISTKNIYLIITNQLWYNKILLKDLTLQNSNLRYSW